MHETSAVVSDSFTLVSHTHAHTHAHTHIRTHARTHTHVHPRMRIDLRVGNESATFMIKGICESFCWLAYQEFKPFLGQVDWLLHFLTVRPWDPLSSFRALTCLDKGPETGGFSRVLGVVGIISIFMY